MGVHTGRLILTIIFLILTTVSLIQRNPIGGVFYGLMAVAVGYPFVRNGEIDLSYQDSPPIVVVVPREAMVAAPHA